jgi:guanylate kinase
MSKLIVFAAPSGAGKTTIVKHLMSKFPQLAFSTSATTRPARTGEQDGVDYYFLSQEGFKQKIAAGAFVEWEEVYTHQFYGTLRQEIERLWNLDRHIIFDIDVKGALNLKQAFPEVALTIFVQAPSLEVLFDRLQSRNTESEAQLQKRMDKAREESSFAPQFDHILINDDLFKAFAEAETLVQDFIEPPLLPLPENEYPEQ